MWIAVRDVLGAWPALGGGGEGETGGEGNKLCVYLQLLGL